MSFFAYSKSPFEYTHENKLFLELYNWLHDAWFHRPEPIHLIGNILLDGRQIDDLILKSNAAASRYHFTAYLSFWVTP